MIDPSTDVAATGALKCISISSGFTINIGLAGSCPTVSSNVPYETYNYRIKAINKNNAASFAIVPININLMHECYYTTMSTPKITYMKYIVPDLADVVSSDL